MKNHISAFKALRNTGEGGYGAENHVHTSINEQELDPEVSVADTHEEDVVHIVVELKVVIPYVAHELLDLCLLRSLVDLRGQ